MLSEMTNYKNNVVFTHFSKISPAGRGNVSTGNTVEYQVVDGKGPSPLELGEGLRALLSEFSDQELTDARKRLAERAAIDSAGLSLAGLRLRAGLSQADLADILGTSQSRVSRIEAGREEPGFSFLTRLSDALGSEPNELFAALKATLK